jgi:hypothetical protein
MNSRLHITDSRRQERRPLRSIAALAAATAFAAGSAAAATTGTINTGALFSPSNQSVDGTTYFNAPTNGPFSLVTVGEFDFSAPAGQMVSGGAISGNFGSNALASGTAQVNLYADGLFVATCNAACELASNSNDVAWSYTLTSANIAALAGNANWQSGKIVLTALQLDPSQVVLDPTSVNLTTTPVPLPAAAWLLGSALAPLFGMGRRKAKALRA